LRSLAGITTHQRAGSARKHRGARSDKWRNVRFGGCSDDGCNDSAADCDRWGNTCSNPATVDCDGSSSPCCDRIVVECTGGIRSTRQRGAFIFEYRDAGNVNGLPPRKRRP